MYHCHLRFYCVGLSSGQLEILRAFPPKKGFSHSFEQDPSLRLGPLAEADVVLARWPLRKPEELAGLKKPGARFILMAGPAEITALSGDAMGLLDDIWPAPADMAPSELRFRFSNLLRAEKAEKDGWEARSFLAAGMNGSPNLVWFKDKNGIHEKVNDSFCETVCKQRSQVEGQTHACIWDVEEDDPACVRSEQEVMRQGRTCVSEETIQTSKGARQLLTYKSPLYDVDGSVMGTVGIAMDATRERTFQAEGQRKGQIIERLFATIDCGVMCHSLDGKQIFSINPAALELLGYRNVQEMLDDGFNLVAQSVLDEDKPVLRAGIASLTQEGDSTNVEYRVRHRDGRLLHILGNIKLTRENGKLCYQRFLLDITDQKRREIERWAERDRELAYKEQMLNVFSTFLSDKVDDVYVMLDGSGTKVEFITPNVERVLGISMKDVLRDLRALGEPKWLSGKRIGREELAALQPGMSMITARTERIHRKSGEQRHLQESVYCVSMQGAKKIIVYLSDRTEEGKTQKALAEALNMAQVANRAKSTFLSSISHDIRTPMNAIIGLLTLLKDEVNDPARVLEYTQKISAASQHLLGLINDVLDMNKIESGSAVLNLSEMGIADLIDELNTIIRPQARARQQTFDIRTSIVHERLVGDMLRINQIMINILSNAVKYTQVGGRIEMRVEELPQADPAYCRMRFTVSDNGHGMSKEYQQIIFDPFTRERELVWNQTQGTGLGMSITKRLVDLMGGSISVDSEPGKGSTFTVELLLRPEEDEADRDFWIRSRIRRMIVADDDEDICHGVVRQMKETGVKVDYATDGQTAVKIIRAAREAGEPYDLILLDWKMPGLDGVKTARLIRENYPENPPIFLFTAYDWADIEQEAREVGIRHFLPKPFFLSSFKEAIRRLSEESLAGKEENSPESVFSGRRIMVVDDIEVNRMILVKILTSLGADCETAVDGQDAANKFVNSRPGDYDIILMDIQMPNLNGYDATRAIRASAHPSAHQVAIVAMSANAFTEDIRQSLESGMDAHISKPVVVEQLTQTLREVLKNARPPRLCNNEKRTKREGTANDDV